MYEWFWGNGTVLRLAKEAGSSSENTACGDRPWSRLHMQVRMGSGRVREVFPCTFGAERAEGQKGDLKTKSRGDQKSRVNPHTGMEWVLTAVSR